MSSEYTCNVEKLAEERKEEVRQFFYTQILSQYKDTKEIIDWCLSSLFDKYPVLGTAHWNIWEEQTGEWLERAVLFNFGIERNAGDVILNDDELKLLANISAISNVGKENFYDLSQAISTRKTPITGFISTDNLFLYVLNDATDTLLKAMLYYKKLYIPLEDTYLINLPEKAIRYDKIPTLPLYFGTQGEYSPTAPQYAVVLAYDGWSYSLDRCYDILAHWSYTQRWNIASTSYYDYIDIYSPQKIYYQYFDFDKLLYKYPVQLQYNSPKGTTMIGFTPKKAKRRIFHVSYVKLN